MPCLFEYRDTCITKVRERISEMQMNTEKVLPQNILDEFSFKNIGLFLGFLPYNSYALSISQAAPIKARRGGWSCLLKTVLHLDALESNILKGLLRYRLSC